jgi:hypothetical protein
MLCSVIRRSLLLASVLVVVGGSVAQAVDVTVAGTPRQAFSGFGVSQIAYDGEQSQITNIPTAIRAQMADMIYTDLNTRILRMWLGPGSSAGTRNFYRDVYAPEAAARGVTTHLMAPGIGEPRPANDDYAGYGRSVANYIKSLKDLAQPLRIDVTGMNNEPGMHQDPQYGGWSYAGINTTITTIRARLDELGCQSTKIVAPEGANADEWVLGSAQSMRADAATWEAILGIASHSYSMAALESIGQVALQGNREYWMTESSENGAESMQDSGMPYRVASRFVNDMNHGVTHWIYFIGYYSEVNNSNSDTKTKLINYDPSTGQIQAWPKYYYLKHLLSDFTLGSRFRHCIRPAGQGGEMNWSNSDAGIYVATAQRTDNSWAVAVTSNGAKTVNLDITELHGSGTQSFAVKRSRLGQYAVSESAVAVVNGQVSIQMGTNELLTLTSNPPAPVNQAPTVSAGADASVTLPAGVNLDGTVSDDGLPTASLTTAWTKVSGPGTVTFGTASAVDTTANFSAAGSYTLRLTASDGQPLSAADDVVITVDPQAGPTDTTPPVAPALPGLAGDGGPAPQLSGITEAGATITVWEGTTALATVVADGGGVWTITLSGLGDGTHTLNVTATDASGNRSVPSPIVVVIVDATAPAVPAVPTVVGDGTANPRLNGTTEAGATVVIREGSTVLGSVVAGGDGTWTVTLGSLATGAHQLTIFARDAGGNASGDSIQFVVVRGEAGGAAPANPANPATSAGGINDCGSGSALGLMLAALAVTMGIQRQRGRRRC